MDVILRRLISWWLGASVLFLAMLFLATGPALQVSAADDSQWSENAVALDQYNLRLKIPPTWFFVPSQEPHFVASLVSEKREDGETTITSTRYSVFLAELKEGLTIEELMVRSARGKAYQMGQRTLIKLGNQEEVEVAGLKGREDMYSFSAEGRAFTYVVVGVEKNGMGYIVDFWSLRGKGSKMAFDRFRNWLKNGVAFIDPGKDISEEMKLKLRERDEALSGPGGSPGGATVEPAFAQKSSPNSSDDIYAAQKRFMAQKIPESEAIHVLAQKAMIAEHAGKFAETKDIYEQLLLKKDEVEAALGVQAWVMLHPAVQRISELTGDEVREKAMLVWIRDLMMAESGAYHPYLSGLLPNVQDHLRSRLKKYDLL